MIYGLAAYLLWGAFPAYFPLLKPASPLEIMAHRIVWTCVVMAVVVVATKQAPALRRMSLRTWGWVSAAGVLIAANWVIYVLAVNTGHVAEAALGYFMNPLVAVMLGMVVLHERLRPAQQLSVGIATVAVLIMAIVGGNPPWIGLGLAFSFALYGLLKKQVKLPATVGLFAETLVLTPVALLYIVHLERSGAGTLVDHGQAHFWLLLSTGIVTAVPLLLFGLGAQRIPLSTIGMMQYMTPSMQMLWAVFVMGEQLTFIRWCGFIIIWISIAIYLADLTRAHRLRQRQLRLQEKVPSSRRFEANPTVED
ncbi:EamA family transporter RarD [Corynebacterium choanae]|uniref:EamA-like transporter family protein n=1 Tax=Corynebacterium choanae TaxID=1862358 RepID=A0A3G6J7Y0_9CORY|nr:EamA family transporter RarD [Corynebacterium choanae]AZA13922.1 EamA-like transporter family protein [Corynebacterium choanae]